jgi:UDP-glucose 4-epimerase
MQNLVTGGAGFIGTHLCEALASLGQDVTILDNLSTGTRGNIRQALESTRYVKLIVGDCKDLEDTRRSISEADVVYHFAANPEVRLELADPSTSYRENVYATHILLEAIKDTNVNTIVFASTSTVYGDAKIVPTPEIYSPLEPISIYGASKLASEALITSYCHTYNKKAVILRFANVVGPRSRHGVINDFITKLRRNTKELVILGDGHQTKSYLYVEDCIGAILRACETAKETVEIFNVGSDDQIEVARIAKIVAEEMDLNDVQFSFTGGVQGGRGWVGDVKNMFLNTSKLKSRGWKPVYNSEEAIRIAAKLILSTMTQ